MKVMFADAVREVFFEVVVWISVDQNSCKSGCSESSNLAFGCHKMQAISVPCRQPAVSAAPCCVQLWTAFLSSNEGAKFGCSEQSTLYLISGSAAYSSTSTGFPATQLANKVLVLCISFLRYLSIALLPLQSAVYSFPIPVSKALLFM